MQVQSEPRPFLLKEPKQITFTIIAMRHTKSVPLLTIVAFATKADNHIGGGVCISATGSSCVHVDEKGRCTFIITCSTILKSRCCYLEGLSYSSQ